MKSSLCPLGKIPRLGVAAVVGIAGVAIAAAGHSLSAQESDFQIGLNRAIPVFEPAFHPKLARAVPLSFYPAGLDQHSAVSSDSAEEFAANLPEEPQPMGSFPDFSSSLVTDSDPQPKAGPDPVPPTGTAPFYHRYIHPGETAQQLTPGQVVVFGLAQTVSPYFLLTISAAAGYEQAVNGSPNYGSNIRAYGQRVGAAAARNASQSVFSYSVMAPLLHEDARYYIMGHRRNAFIRATYAASRAVVTRDARDGHATPNFAEISGYAEAAGLTNAYYPPVNRTFGRTTKSFGVSLGGLALSNVVREFLPDILRVAHLEKFE